MSLLNVDSKILSKALSTRTKGYWFCYHKLPTAYVPGRYIRESVRLISDIQLNPAILNTQGKQKLFRYSGNSLHPGFDIADFDCTGIY